MNGVQSLGPAFGGYTANNVQNEKKQEQPPMVFGQGGAEAAGSLACSGGLNVMA